MPQRDLACIQCGSEGQKGVADAIPTAHVKEQVCGQAEANSGRVRSERPKDAPGRRMTQWLLGMKV